MVIEVISGGQKAKVVVKGDWIIDQKCSGRRWLEWWPEVIR